MMAFRAMILVLVIAFFSESRRHGITVAHAKKVGEKGLSSGTEEKWRRRAIGATKIDYDHYGGHPFARMAEARRQRRLIMMEEDEQQNTPRKLDWSIGADDSDAENENKLGPDPNFDPNHIPAPLKFDTAYFRPIQIQFKYDHLPSTPTTQRHVELLQDTVMPRVAEFWAHTLSVFPTNRLYVDSTACTLSSTLDFVNGVTDTDLLIQVVNNEKFCSGNTLAAANSCDWDEYDRPIGGLISFCFSNIELRGNGSDPASEVSTRKVVSAAIHEVAHILGFHENDFAYFYDAETGEPRTTRPIPQNQSHKCISGDTQSFDMPSDTTVQKGETPEGIKYFEIVTPKILQTARNHFDCQTMTGVRLENQPTGGSCIGTHLDERLFFTESMSAIATTNAIPAYLSPITLALFEDSGWYLANYTNVHVSPFGHGRGCDFVHKPCIVESQVPDYSTGVFCNTMDQNEYSCDPTHSIMSHCDLMDYSAWGEETSINTPTDAFQYFGNNKTLGGKVRQADYCPTWSVYVSDCKGPPLKESLMTRGETFGHSNSRCINSNQGRPVCMESVCNHDDFTIDIIMKEAGDDGKSDEIFQCRYNETGTRITLPRAGVGIFCPNFAEFCPDMLCPSSCAGRGVCIYNAERPVCECFDQNETSPSCQTYEIDYTKVFTPPLTPMLNPNNERAGLNLEFDNGEDFTAADQMSEAPTSSAFTRSTIRRGPSATSAVLIGLAILLAM